MTSRIFWARVLSWFGVVFDYVDIEAWGREQAQEARRDTARRLAWSLIDVPGFSRALWRQDPPDGWRQ